MSHKVITHLQLGVIHKIAYPLFLVLLADEQYIVSLSYDEALSTLHHRQFTLRHGYDVVLALIQHGVALHVHIGLGILVAEFI